MPAVMCGTGVRYGAFDTSSSGCLVSFTDDPTKVLVLGAAHGLIPTTAKKGDAIISLALPDQVFGRLLTWTTFRQAITADAALAWVDPALALPQIVGLGVPAGVNVAPQVGDTVQLFPRPAGDRPRTSKIQVIGQTVPVDVRGPDWFVPGVSYQNQIVCQPMFDQPGDSGAVVFDSQNRVVGMVVAGQPAILQGSVYVSQTIITPIASILTHPDFGGRQLAVLSAMPNAAVAPGPAPAAA